MIGRILGNRYEILSEIGSGGMAKVYKARCQYLQRNVAIKILRDEFKHDSEFLKRFETEALAAASLAHPNIVQIYDVGKDQDLYYIVMEYVEGITLKEYIEQRHGLEWREAVNIAVQICSALSKAHNRKIIHRDIKPQNILMTTDGVPKVTDFGIARAASADTATMRVDTIGSVHYSSPEQVRGGYTDEKSDIYSIGVTLFEMVTGTLPFDGETTVAIALKHIQDPPPLPTEVKPGLPEAMNMIIMKAMAKAKHDRYDSVADMMNDLENMRAKPGESLNIVLPNVRHDQNKYNTKKIETIGDDEMARGEEKVAKKRQTKASSILLPILYIVLIGAIVGSVYFFVNSILNGLIPAESNQPKEFTVGSYVGRDISEVEAELKRAGLEAYDIEYIYDDKVVEGRIINQEPRPQSTIKTDGFTRLKLVVSKGEDLVEIPNITNVDHTALKYQLQDEYKLLVDEKAEFSEDIGVGLVTKIDPEPGTKVKRGTKVTIYYSLGPEKKEISMPDLIGLTYNEALALLADYNLKLGRTFPEDRNGFQGKIVDQSPKVGESVLEESAVDIYFEDTAAPSTSDEPTPPPTTGGSSNVNYMTIQVNLPSNVTEDSVRLKAIVINNATNDETIFRDETVPVSEFPYAILAPIPAGGGVTVRVFINNVLSQEQVY
jgi:serine/threonine protein kinase